MRWDAPPQPLSIHAWTTDLVFSKVRQGTPKATSTTQPPVIFVTKMLAIVVPIPSGRDIVNGKVKLRFTIPTTAPTTTAPTTAAPTTAAPTTAPTAPTTAAPTLNPTTAPTPQPENLRTIIWILVGLVSLLLVLVAVFIIHKCCARRPDNSLSEPMM